MTPSEPWLRPAARFSNPSYRKGSAFLGQLMKQASYPGEGVKPRFWRPMAGPYPPTPESPPWGQGTRSQPTNTATVSSILVLQYTPFILLSLAMYFQLYSKNIWSTKINSKCFKDPNVRHDTVKLLDENIGETLWHKSQQHFQSPKAKEIKAKINKWDLIKLKHFAQQRKPSTKWKDNLQNGRKYLQMMQPTRS